MDLKEFKKLKVGDKVQIVKSKGNYTRMWNSDGDMDKWLGKVMTVRAVGISIFDVKKPYISMEEDKNEACGDGWWWFPEMIEKKVEGREETVIVIKTDGKTVTAYRGEEKGVAKCSPEDEFDLYTGASLALDRLFGREEKKPLTVNDIRRAFGLPEIKDIPTEALREKHEAPKQFKPGDKVRVISKRTHLHQLFGWTRGMDKWLGKVVTIRGPFEGCEDLYWIEEDKNEYYGSFGAGFLWKVDWFEGKVDISKDEVKEPKEFKPGDVAVTYARLTDSDAVTPVKLMTKEETKPEVREVKRKAKKDDWIKIVDPSCTRDCYYKGDILKVYRRDRKHEGVYCELEKKVKSKDGWTNHKGNLVINDYEYVVLENYEPPKPEVKEVKRHAKVGEWVKIVEPMMAIDLYKENDILKCCNDYSGSRHYDWGIDVELKTLPRNYYIYDGEYVVLENYQPEEK